MLMKRKKEETWPRKLANHRTANLKAECLNVFHKRYSERDSETFKSLFGERDNPEDYLKRIRAEGADKFNKTILAQFGTLEKNHKLGGHHQK